MGNTGTAELNLSALAGWRRGRWQHEVGGSRFAQQLAILRAAHIGNLTDLQLAIQSPIPLNNRDAFDYALLRPRQDVQHNTLKYKAVARLSELWKLSTQYSFQYNQRREYDVVRSSGAAATRPQVSFRLWTNTLDVSAEHLPLRHWQGGVGVQAVQQTNFVSRGGFIPDYRSAGGGLWVSERWRRFPSPWEVEAGARYDFRRTAASTTGSLSNVDTLVQFGNLSGTLGLICHLGSHWRLGLNTGRAWRPPHVNELFARGVHHGAGTYEAGNARLRPEQAWNTQLHLRYERGEASFQISAYRNALRDFIYLDPALSTVLTVRGAFPAYFYEQAQRAVLQGFDAQGEWPLSHGFSVEGAASLLRGHREVAATGGDKKQDWLPLMPADRLQCGLRWKSSASARRKGSSSARLGMTTVLHQSRIPQEGLLKPAPAGFSTLSAEFMHSIALGSRSSTDLHGSDRPSLQVGLTF
ncbi:MAG TPA: TonB-dependent receptor, partial [Saprospiraceae bacterium]|nr:TonB-dependent receptor [Saprospiraceae bacterium]